MKEPVCLVTAFDKFGDLKSNHSELVLDSLPTFLDPNIRIDKLLLPTCGVEAWKVLQPHMENGLDSLIMTGAGWGSKIVIERAALNIRHYDIKDNGGYHWQDSQLNSERRK